MSNIHNLSIEQCVLVALMTVQNSLETVMSDLDIECFCAERHKAIFKAITELSNENKPYDAVLVEQKLIETKTLELSGGSKYLLQMMGDSASSFYNLESYVAQLNKFKSHREVEQIGQSIQEAAKDLTVPDIHNAAESI
ncbi:MAG: DnaB-like helicase N-terminal domain-containing protein, partial [Acinetobacter sp.]